MSQLAVGIVIGLFVGGPLGMFVLALCIVGAREDRRMGIK